MSTKKIKSTLFFIIGVVVVIGAVIAVRYILENKLPLSQVKVINAEMEVAENAVNENAELIQENNIAEFNTIDSENINNSLTFLSPEGETEFSMKVKKISQKENTELVQAVETVKKAQNKLYLAVSNGQLKEGMEEYSQNIISVYKFPELYTQSLAFAYLTTGDCQQSAQLYQELVTSYPQNFSGFFGRALSYQVCSQPQKALEAYQATLETFPGGNGRYNYIVQQIKTLSNQVS